MKLSDVKGERTLDVIADIVVPVANIAEDKEAAEMFSRKKAPAGADPRSFLLSRIRRILPSLLKGHKKDVIAILAAIEGVTPEAYAEGLDLLKLTTDCVDLFTDEAFTALFISAQSEKRSGSAPVNTTGSSQ